MTVVQGYKVEIINVVNVFNNLESNRGKKVNHLFKWTYMYSSSKLENTQNIVGVINLFDQMFKKKFEFLDIL